MRKDLLVILCAFFVVATAWNFLIPPYENLDELEHAEVVRHIAVTGTLPVHGAAEAAGFHVRQEASQPPLYYILAAGWSRLWGLSLAPHAPQPVPENLVECGPSDTFYNKATWVQSSEWNGTLHTTRLFSTLLQMATVAGVWTLARRIFPAGPVPFLSAALVAFNPQFLLVASGVNNDNAVTPLATWGLVVAFDLWDRGPTSRRVLLFGTISGLAALSKLSGIGLLGLGGLALLIRAWQHKMPLRHFVEWGVLMIVPAVVLVAPWMLRNVQLYGDPTALAPMLEKVGKRAYPITLSESVPMLLSYWGQMPCSFYPRAVYWPYFLTMIGGIIGLTLGWLRFDRRQKVALALSLVWFAVIVLAWLRWNAITPATGGRLLFPAIAALGLVLAAGWRALPPHIVRMWAALLPMWAIMTLVAGPIALFALPARLPLEAQLPNPLAISFGDDIALHGYEVHVIKPRLACMFAASSYCRPTLDVTLYWQATKPISKNLTLVLQLVSPVPGETDLRMNYNHWPGHGNLPTSAWPISPILRDRYVLPIPKSEAPVQAWALQIALVDDETGIRRQTYDNGTPTGDTTRLALLRVPGAPVTLLQQASMTPTTFGDAASLLDASVTKTDGNWQISLLWESQGVFDNDYTVFVHAYADDGELLATGDGPPQKGHFPTSMWQSGDRVLDVHLLSLPENITPARIAVGLYSPATGERVPATVNENPLPDNAVIIWEAQP